MRAVVVLPMPRTPVSIHACDNRPAPIALVSVRTIASCPINSSNVAGLYLRARTRYAVVASGAGEEGSKSSVIKIAFRV